MLCVCVCLEWRRWRRDSIGFASGTFVRWTTRPEGGGAIAKFLFFSRKEILLEYVYLLYSAVCVPIVRPHVYMMRERANSSLSLTTWDSLYTRDKPINNQMNVMNDSKRSGTFIYFVILIFCKRGDCVLPFNWARSSLSWNVAAYFIISISSEMHPKQKQQPTETIE